MAKKDIEVREVWQNLIANWLHENIDADPDQVARFFANNIFQRTLAHLYGKSGTRSIPLEVTASGELKVATIGIGLEHYDYTAHTAANDNAISVVFTEVVSSIDIIIEDQNALVRFTPDGTTWSGWFLLKSVSSYSKDVAVHTMEVKNAGAGSNHSARIWGYY